MLLFSLAAYAQQPLKIISYNILMGMKTDTTEGKQQFVAWVKEKDPDILALQECNGFTQKSLEALAATYGHPYAVIVQTNGYPTGLTSKYPIAAIQKVNENMTHGFIMARIEHYNIVVLHFNPHQYRKRREEVAMVLKYIALEEDRKNWVIMGDFNSHSPLDKALHSNGRVIARQQSVTKERPHIHNLINDKEIDYTVQQSMLDAGFVDAVHAGGNATSDSRIDYIYVSKDLRRKLRHASFILDDFTKKFSDHRPIILELKNQK